MKFCHTRSAPLMSLQYRSFPLSGGFYRLSCGNPHVSVFVTLIVQNIFLSDLSSDVQVSLPESSVTIFDTAIQLWRKVPTQHESFNVTTDAPHNWRHARDAEKGRARSGNGGLSTKSDPTTASNIGPNLSNGSAMEIPASSLLVFGGQEMLRVVPYDEPIWSSIPRTQWPVSLTRTLLIEYS